MSSLLLMLFFIGLIALSIVFMLAYVYYRDSAKVYAQEIV